MTRLLIASRTRPDIDLPRYLGMYEFSVVPRSLFTTDGTLNVKHLVLTQFSIRQRCFGHLMTKQFLSAIKTKNELTEYLKSTTATTY